MGEGQAANEEPQRLSVAGGLDHGACLGHGKHHATLTAPGRKLCKKLGLENPPHPHRALHAKPWRHLPRAHVRLIIVYTQKRVEISPLVEMAFQGLRDHYFLHVDK